MTRAGNCAVLAVAVALLGIACGNDGPTANLVLLVLAGDQNPLRIESASVDVELLELVVDGPDGSNSEAFFVNQGPSFERDLDLVPSSNVRLSLTALDPRNSSVYSAGRSQGTLDLVAGETITAPVFMAPVETLTRVGLSLPSPRAGARAAPLGGNRILVVGGFDIASSGVTLADPALAIYDHGQTAICAATCLSGTSPSPRLGAVAVALADGSVLHGLGDTSLGRSGELFVTTPDGATQPLTVNGVLPAASFSSAVVQGDTLYLFGGVTSVGATDSVWRLTINNGTAELDALSPLNQARSHGSAIVLDTETFLVVGGRDDASEILEAELYVPGIGAVDVPGGGGAAGARGALSAGRLEPSLVPLVDGSVLVVGGGDPGVDPPLELYNDDLGTPRGGFIDVSTSGQTALLQQSAPQAVRLGNEVLLTGGEPTDSPDSLAVILTPLANTLTLPSTQSYAVSYRDALPSDNLRGFGALAPLSDGSVAVIGGASRGVTNLNTDNPALGTVEIIVPAP